MASGVLMPLLVLAMVLGCSAAPTTTGPTATGPTSTGPTTTGPTIAPAPTIPPTKHVIGVQKQVYIVTGVFGAFILVLLVVSLLAATLVLRLRHKVRLLSPAAGPAAGTAPQRRLTKADRKAEAGALTEGNTQPFTGRDNRGYSDDQPESRPDLRDDVQDRYNQYPDQMRQGAWAGAGARSSPDQAPTDHNRFHQPMPDAYIPSEDHRSKRGSSDRYGPGNLARLPKGPAPLPPGYERDYPSEERRPRGPARHAQW